MFIDPQYKPVREILNMGFFEIPRFQRPYSWDEQHLDDFWTDTIATDGQGEYFIGSFVLFRQNTTTLGIVDGQQRLTTIVMILCAIRDQFRAMEMSDLADGMHGLIERRDVDNKKQAVLQSKSSHPYLQASIQKLSGTDPELAESVEEKRLESSFAYISAKVSSAVSSIMEDESLSKKRKLDAIEVKLKGLRDCLLNLSAVALVLDDDDDAYMIFETLNTRGKDLELADLFRTHLTKCIPTKNKSVDQTRTKFDLMRRRFSNKRRKLDDFVLHFWLSRYDYLAKRKIYKQLKREVKPNNARKFYDEFIADGNLYLDVVSPAGTSWTFEERTASDALSAIQLFRVEQPLPFLLALYRSYKSKIISLKTCRRAFIAVEHFHFAFTAITSSRSSGGISQMYARHAARLAKANSAASAATQINELIEKLQMRRPSYDEFLASFRELRASEEFQRDKRLVAYILRKLALVVGDRQIDGRSQTIEHLAAQSGKNTAFSAERRAEIGNLTLVSDELQGKLGVKSVSQKVTIIKNAGCWVDDLLSASATDWNESAVRARTDYFAKVAYESVWKIQ
jgi:hypothetical protein